MTQTDKVISDRLSTSAFGTTEDGRPIHLYHLRNAQGTTVSVCPVGGLIVSLRTPDKHGTLGDVVLGFNQLADYLSDTYRQETPFFGALIGRYCNRINRGRFILQGKSYQLTCNERSHHLHGGNEGFDQCHWSITPFETNTGCGVELTLTRPDGDQGYPGELKASVRYTLDDNHCLTLDYTATTDAPTHVNLTQHSYFNLEGEGIGDILGHELMIAADQITPVDETLIPTGELDAVAGTPFDFTTPKPIGRDIDHTHAQLERGQGYDHNFVLKRADTDANALVTAARLVAPKSGRVMEVHTTEPGLQFYSGNFLNGRLVGKSGHAYQYRYGLALETQHFPDTPNQPQFPTTLLEPGQVYRSQTQYRFSTLAE